MIDNDISFLENELKELREKRETIKRKREELSMPPAVEVQPYEDLKPYFYKGNTTEKDDLDKQRIEMDREIEVLVERIRLHKLGI